MFSLDCDSTGFERVEIDPHSNVMGKAAAVHPDREPRAGMHGRHFPLLQKHWCFLN